MIDILLVIKIRNDLESKKEFAINNYNSSSSNENSILKEKFEKKLDEITKAERNTIKMIVYSLLLYTVCRLPELCLYMYLIIVDQASSFAYAALKDLFATTKTTEKK